MMRSRRESLALTAPWSNHVPARALAAVPYQMSSAPPVVRSMSWAIALELNSNTHEQAASKTWNFFTISQHPQYRRARAEQAPYPTGLGRNRTLWAQQFSLWEPFVVPQPSVGRGAAHRVPPSGSRTSGC